MNSKELLNFVLSLRERVTSKAHANGVTAWALGIAVLYLLSQALPSVAKLKYSLIPLDAFIVFFTHTMGTLIALNWLQLSLKGNSKFSRFDYRFLKRNPSRTISAGISFLLVEGVYFLFSMITIISSYSVKELKHGIYSNNINIGISGFEYCLLFVSMLFFGFFFIVLIWFVFQILSEYIENDFYPSKHSLIKKTSNTLKFDSVIVIALSANVYYILFPTIAVGIDEYKELILLSFQLGLILCGISSYLKNFSDSNTLDLLNKLERDIVLHEISEEEIKLRLQDEYYGNEFQSWVVEQISNIRDISTELQSKIENLENFKYELNLVNKELRFERQGRVEEYRKNIGTQLEKLMKKSTELSLCLNEFLPVVKDDNYLNGFINDKLSESKTILNSIQNKSKNAILELEQLI
ncbi:MAG: hypothetical protein HOP25_05560 [Methylotenera sp.]|nr:hypothetical protein [Methylotenera sp.]